VTVHHPNADDFLERDCENVANFSRRQGVDVTSEGLEAFVTGETVEYRPWSGRVVRSWTLRR
jgi:RIO kinase 1